MIRRRLLVSGRVQGVFYRDSCKATAQGAGVAGSARNLPDGRVEIILEGDTDAVDEVIAWCRKGTSQSKVESVEVSEEEPAGSSGFGIL
jgi:acylphosphatase